jgi:hypothetical protein
MFEKELRRGSPGSIELGLHDAIEFLVESAPLYVRSFRAASHWERLYQGPKSEAPYGFCIESLFRQSAPAIRPQPPQKNDSI